MIRPGINEDVVLYVQQPMRVCCDRNCGKAWGISQRPRVQFSDDPDDFAYLADGELGRAPANPGTYEGGVAKPASPDEFPTKWCVRECERCSHSAPGRWPEPLGVLDFSRRVYNLPERLAQCEPEDQP